MDATDESGRGWGMSPIPKRKGFGYSMRLLRDRFLPTVPVPLIALVAVFVIALLTTGIGYLIFRR